MVRNIETPDIAQFIAPLNMNGLQGRMMVAPALKNRRRDILVVSGHHTKLEQWWDLVQKLQAYGTVTMPDLPGFGGMQSFRRIGKQPTVDNYADYLSAFVKMRYKHRRVTIIGVSFGFVVVTRMLQRYPELVGRVDILVSLAGFVHRDDFLITAGQRRILGVVARLISVRPLAWMLRHTVFALPKTYGLYDKLPVGQRRLLSMDSFAEYHPIASEKMLWRLNDLSSHWRVISSCMQIDNCHKKIDLPLWHICTQQGGFIDESVTKQHILIIYQSCRMASLRTAPNPQSRGQVDYDVGFVLPAGLRKALLSL